MFHLKSSEPEKGVSENRDQNVENSEVKSFESSTVESFESSTVEESFENSVVEESFENSVVEESFENSTVDESFENSTVDESFENSTVDESFENSTIDESFENSTIDESFENSTVDESFENSTVDESFENSTVDESFENSTVDESFENSTVDESFENSTVDESFENSTVEENFNSSWLEENFDSSMFEENFESMFEENFDSSIFAETASCANAEETASCSYAQESFDNWMIEETAESSKVDKSIHVSDDAVSDDAVSDDLTEIFSYYVTNPCRKLKIIADILYSLGMTKMRVRYERMKIDSVSDIVMSVKFQDFLVMACANTSFKAKMYAAELMLIRMGFAKSKCLQNSQVEQKPSTSTAASDSAPMICDEDLFRLFADIHDPVTRLNEVVHSLYIAETSLNVKYETYETSTNDIKFVKCTVGSRSTIATGNDVERATRTASFFMLNRLGLQRNTCCLPAEMQRDLKMISDRNMMHMTKARRRLFPA